MNDFISVAGLHSAPYIEQWLGPWAMREVEFHALAETIRRCDLSVHLAGPAPEAARMADPAQASVLPDGVALIELSGRMQKQRASMGQSASTVEARRAVRAAAADPNVGAILLVIDSPGGTVAGTAELAADVAAAARQKQVIGLIEDIGASAAYWVGSQATKLYSQATALVGSIGTYGVVYDASAAAAMEGVKVHVVRAGAMKGAGEPGTEITPEQIADFQREIDALNEHFLAGVGAGRKLSSEKVRALATGQVWIGQQAVEAGLTDGVMNLDQALGQARAASLKQLERNRKMAAASYAEIVAACPGATPEFICEELKANATVDQAVKDFAAHSVLQVEQVKKDADARIAKIQSEADARVAAAEAKAKAPGVDPLRESRPAGDGKPASGSALEEFNAAVEAKVAAGMKRPKAVAAVAREKPELQQAVVTEANAGRRAG